MKNPSNRRSIINRFNCLIILGIILTAVVALALPSVYSSSDKSSNADGGRSAGTGASSNPKLPGYGNWLRGLASAPFTGETIEVFAADCVTPKSAFTLGETVCAKTDGVSLSPSGNYYMNWVDSSLNQYNGGTITQNPQYFLFVPPTATSWKATIGRVSPADSSIIGTPPIFTVTAGPALSTYASNCTTPQTTFTLGDGTLPGETVCAKVSGIDPTFNRRFAWVDPAGNIRKFTTVTTDPQTDSFTLPTDEFDATYQVDNRGVWKVNIISSRGSVVRTLSFRVQAQTPVADLSVAKSLTGASAAAGQPVTFDVSVYNRGPNDAVNVVVTDVTPANATYFSVNQTDGPSFSCTGSTTVTCTGALLKAGETARFELVYTAGTAGQKITNTASASSDTAELNDTDNSYTDGPYTIGTGGGGGGGTCTVACPDDITTPANTNQGGQDGAIVHFSPPSGNEECGNVTADHCNDCFFPEGSTVVTATSASGDTCSFTVTVTPAGSAPTISCPANKTGNADSSCSVTFSLGTANASGQNVTVVGYRSDGKPVYTCDEFGNCTRNSTDPAFSVGVSTVTWYAYAHDIAGPYNATTGDEESHRNGSATCTQTVTVNDVTPPTIAATSQTIAADSSCQAAVPDYSSTVSDNCACSSSDTSEACQNHNDIAYSQTPAAGTMLPPGSYTVHIEANDGTNNATKDITLTIADQTPPTITCPANVVTGTDPNVCSAIVNPGTASASDNCDTSVTIVGTRSDSQPLSAPYPKGTTTIHWTATDDAGNSSSCDQTVTVNDTEPPVIVFNGQTPSMWPPNHKYQTFQVTNFVTSVTDNCDSIAVSSVVITKVTSDEIENGNGDGNTMNDIVIGADCKSVQLRSEREGNSNGRVYTIFFKVVDTSGNVGTGTAKVVVQHNPGETAVDSGAHYTVTSACP